MTFLPAPPFSWSDIRADADYPDLKQDIIAMTGMSYYLDKDDALIERLQKRMEAVGARSCAAYRHLLCASRDAGSEFDQLVADITIGETSFFRYAEQFAALKDRILPECLSRVPARLRIWSAGCANGAEAYSIAAILRDLLGPDLPHWDITILGTDINRQAIEAARRGHYGAWSLRGVAAEDRARMFIAEADGWRLHPDILRMVTFSHHNLLDLVEGGTGPSHVPFDIVLCRNVLIYFAPETIAKLLPRMAELIRQDGWLLTGHAEPGEEFRRVFEAISVPGTTLYRRVSGRPPAMQADSDFPGIQPSTAPAFSIPPARPDQGRNSRTLPEPRFPKTGDDVAPPVATSQMPRMDEIVALANRGAWNEARHCCDRLLRADPTQPSAHFFSGLVDEYRGRLPDAERSYRRALYLDRGYVMAHYHLALMLARQGDRDAARRSLANVARLLADQPDPAELRDGDGMTAGRLRGLVAVHLDAWGRT